MYNRIAELLIGQPRSFHTLRHRNDLTCLSPFPLLFCANIISKTTIATDKKYPRQWWFSIFFPFYPPR